MFMTKIARRLMSRSSVSALDVARAHGFSSIEAYEMCSRRRLLFTAADGGEAEVPTGVLRNDIHLLHKK